MHVCISCKDDFARFSEHNTAWGLDCFRYIVRRLFIGHVLTLRRSPTLSYTQRLEQKVAQLEAALAEACPPASKPQPTHALGEESSNSSYGTQSGPRVAESEGLPLNGSISLFQLPGSIRTLSFERNQADQEVAAKKESLVNSAWRERAYERLADIPVS
jgi:hypothetical protein